MVQAKSSSWSHVLNQEWPGNEVESVIEVSTCVSMLDCYFATLRPAVTWYSISISCTCDKIEIRIYTRVYTAKRKLQLLIDLVRPQFSFRIFSKWNIYSEQNHPSYIIRRLTLLALFRKLRKWIWLDILNVHLALTISICSSIFCFVSYEPDETWNIFSLFLFYQDAQKYQTRLNW